MRKTIAWILIITVALTFAACGNGKNKSKNKQDSDSETTTSSAVEPNPMQKEPEKKDNEFEEPITDFTSHKLPGLTVDIPNTCTIEEEDEAGWFDAISPKTVWMISFLPGDRKDGLSYEALKAEAKAGGAEVEPYTIAGKEGFMVYSSEIAIDYHAITIYFPGWGKAADGKADCRMINIATIDQREDAKTYLDDPGIRFILDSVRAPE